MSCEASCKTGDEGKELDRRMKSALFGGQSCVELTIPQMTTQRSGIIGAGFLSQTLPHVMHLPSSTVVGLLAVLEVSVPEPFILSFPPIVILDSFP